MTRPGRQPQVIPRQRNQIAMNVSAETKRRIVDAARRSNRTVSAEAEHRIWQSFFIDDLVAARLASRKLAEASP